MQTESLHKKYGLFTAIAMVVGIVIGSGVFFKAQVILEKTEGNMPLGILAWIIGGFIMLSCILAFAVMATRYEKVNGIVDYAEETVGSRYGYMIGWFAAIIYYPSMTSVLAWLSARYTLVFIASAFPDLPLTVSVKEGGCVVGPECMVLSLFFLCAAYTVNALSPVIAGKFQVATTVIKLIPLGLMSVVGIVVGLFAEDGVLVENMMHTGSGAAEGGSPLFAAVVATAFAYEGWMVATSINAELRDSKRNLPIALFAGGLIIMAVYIAYYIGVAGGATVDELIRSGATVAFTNVFGKLFGTVLNVFVAVSCMGTLNGLMLGCTRGIFALAARGRGPRPEIFRQVDKSTDMANNSAVLALMLCAAWFVFFYGANISKANWFGVFAFDSSELPIVTIYAMYLPVFIGFMRRATDLGALRRFAVPALAVCGSVFMVIAAIYAHGVQPYRAAAVYGMFSCPVLFYLILYAVIMLIGLRFADEKEK